MHKYLLKKYDIFFNDVCILLYGFFIVPHMELQDSGVLFEKVISCKK